MVDWIDEVCREAETWMGTPYVPQGRVKGVGVDCGGLVYQIFNPHFGPFPPFPTDYAADWALHTHEEKYLDFIMPFVREVDAPFVGGISLFHIGLVYAHAAICVGGPKQHYIHAWGRTNKGHVTKTPYRVMMALSRPHAPKHFMPVK
jgi:cell wall-associated NlpC family hydrolase